METIQYNFVDKSNWGDGPWQTEPDKLQWQDGYTDLPCLIVRGPIGALCGYVGVNPGHPFYNMGYSGCTCPQSEKDKDHEGTGEGLLGHHKCLRGSEDFCPESELSVHGGVTFSGFCQNDEHGICHVVEPGEEENVWWIGFDCAHGGDYWPKYHADVKGIPNFPRLTYMKDDVYRDVFYVQKQVSELAQQLKLLEKGK